jgi:hypothetical protein
MKAFMDKEFMLQSPTAQHLYHDYAADMPICDYHHHTSQERNNSPPGNSQQPPHTPAKKPTATQGSAPDESIC